MKPNQTENQTEFKIDFHKFMLKPNKMLAHLVWHFATFLEQNRIRHEKPLGFGYPTSSSEVKQLEDVELR